MTESEIHEALHGFPAGPPIADGKSKTIAPTAVPGCCLMSFKPHARSITSRREEDVPGLNLARGSNLLLRGFSNPTMHRRMVMMTVKQRSRAHRKAREHIAHQVGLLGQLEQAGHEALASVTQDMLTELRRSEELGTHYPYRQARRFRGKTRWPFLHAGF